MGEYNLTMEQVDELNQREDVKLEAYEDSESTILGSEGDAGGKASEDAIDPVGGLVKEVQKAKSPARRRAKK